MCPQYTKNRAFLFLLYSLYSYKTSMQHSVMLINMDFIFFFFHIWHLDISTTPSFNCFDVKWFWGNYKAVWSLRRMRIQKSTNYIFQMKTPLRMYTPFRVISFIISYGVWIVKGCYSSDITPWRLRFWVSNSKGVKYNTR